MQVYLPDDLYKLVKKGRPFVRNLRAAEAGIDDQFESTHPRRLVRRRFHTPRGH